MPQTSRVLVTGGTGFLGRALVACIAGSDVVVHMASSAVSWTEKVEVG